MYFKNKSHLSFIKIVLIFSIWTIFIVSSCSYSKNNNEKAEDNYSWQNLPIGGGGYVTGAYIHPLDPDLIYMRTDVGGAFRYNKQAEKMEQLFNWVSIEESNLYGVYGMALDPLDTNHIFVSAGRYPFAFPSDVFESRDQGKNWKALGLNKPMGANKHPEKIGIKLVLNPFNFNELWCASYGEGLWIYLQKEQKWTSHPFSPKDDNIQSIIFDKSDSNNIYISTIKSGIYRSTDGGREFKKIKTYTWDNSSIKLSEDGKILYATSLSQGVFRLNNPSQSIDWKDITPDKQHKEYRAVEFAGGIVYTAPAKPMNALKWGFFSSSDMGDSWKLKPSVIDQNIAWQPETFPGSAISEIVADPSDPNRLIITDWFSIFECKNASADTLVWSNKIAKGHEEVVCLNMKSLPFNDKNIALYSGHADIAGFSHKSSISEPEFIFKKSYGQAINNLTGLAFCEQHPEFVYSLGSADHNGNESNLAISENYGENWRVIESFGNYHGWGRIAVSASNSEKIVAVTQHTGVIWSENSGLTWQKAEGAPDNIIRGPVFRYNYPLVADKVDGDVCYLYSINDSALYLSEDFGKTWKKKPSGLAYPAQKFFKSQLDTDYWKLESVPGYKGHLFLALANEGLFFSDNAGESWQKINGLEKVPLVAVGIGRSKKAYPSVYALASTSTDSAFWYYRSDDRGGNWIKINDNNTRIGNNPQFMEADRQKFGKVYIGTNGSGIIVGEPNK